MKNIFKKSAISLVLITLLTVHCNAQSFGRVKGSGTVIHKIRNVGDFDKIGVSGSFDVYLVKGEEGKLDIKIEDNLLNYLVTDVEGGKLKIKWKKGVNISTRKGVVITVYFKDINALVLSGSADIIGKDLIKSNIFDLAVSGSGDMDLNLEVNTLNTSISGSGDLDLEGTAKAFKSSVSGSGDISAYNLVCDKAEVRVSGSGGITLTVHNELTAKVSGSGEVHYKGKPKIEDIKVSGSGDVSSY